MSLYSAPVTEEETRDFFLMAPIVAIRGAGVNRSTRPSSENVARKRARSRPKYRKTQGIGKPCGYPRKTTGFLR